MDKEGLRQFKYPQGYVPVLLFVAFAAVGLYVGSINKFYAHIIVVLFLSAGLAGAWNLIGGYGGQLSLGHAAFYGIGAYSAAFLFANNGLSPWLGMVIGGVVAAIIGIFLGGISLKLKGPFFTLVTIAFAEVVRIIAINVPDITGGSIGMIIPFRPGFANMIFREKFNYMLLALGFMVLVYLISVWIERTRLGYYLMATRENEDAAQALTINTAKYKVVAMTLSAFLMGVGGVINAQYVLFIEPISEFDLMTSVNPALMAMIGGVSTAAGPIMGAIVMTPLQEFLRGWLGGIAQGLHLLVYGFILVLVVIYMPMGFVGLVRKPYYRLLDRLPILGTVETVYEQKEQEARMGGR